MALLITKLQGGSRGMPGSVPESVPNGCVRGSVPRGSGVSKKCPESVPGVTFKAKSGNLNLFLRILLFFP